MATTLFYFLVFLLSAQQVKACLCYLAEGKPKFAAPLANSPFANIGKASACMKREEDNERRKTVILVDSVPNP